MNILRELLTYLEDNTSLVIGTDLFQGVLPEGTIEGTVFRQVGGTQSMSGMVSVLIAINTFYRDYDTAIDNLETLHNMLSYSKGIQLPNIYVFDSEPMKHPGFITQTEQSIFICSSSVVLHYGQV